MKKLGYTDGELRDLFAADKYRGSFDAESKWADAIRDALGTETVTPDALATATGLTAKQLGGGVRVLVERGFTVVRVKDGYRVATTDDEKARWLKGAIRQATADVTNIAAAPSARFPESDALPRVRKAAEKRLAALTAASAPMAVVVDLKATPSPTPEPAAKPRAKRSKKPAPVNV